MDIETPLKRDTFSFCPATNSSFYEFPGQRQRRQLVGPYPAVPVAGIEISRINMWCLVFSDAEIAMKSGIVHMVKAQAG